MNANKRITSIFGLLIALSMLLSACAPRTADVNGKAVTVEFAGEHPSVTIVDGYKVSWNLFGADVKPVDPAKDNTLALAQQTVQPTASVAGVPANYRDGVAGCGMMANGNWAEFADDGSNCYKGGTMANVSPTAGPTQTSNVNTSAQPTAGNMPLVYKPFFADWTKLDVSCPDDEQVLKDHGLTTQMVIIHQNKKVSWEPCLKTYEFKPEYRGSIVKLDVFGYADTIALVNADVTDFLSGDPQVTSVKAQWGFSARWGASYLPSKTGNWLDGMNTCEWNVRDYRFGRYWRLDGLGLPDVPYYMRVGPYMTMPGNTNCSGWEPPALDEIVPRNYLQATAMLGGLAIESQWKHSNDFRNWAWRFSDTGNGDTYKWQTVYIPQSSNGYVELWVNGGPKKFYAQDLKHLMLDNLNVEAFSYHSDPNY